jgi:hypothetical protein
MYYSPWDISFESIFELWFQLERIQQNRFEDVRLTEVVLDSEITQRNLTATITRVLSGSSLQPMLRKRTNLRARAGSTIRLRVFLQPAGVAAERPVDLTLAVPRRTGQGRLEIRGGNGDEGPGNPDSLDELLANLAGAEHNFDLTAELNVRRATRKAVAAQPDVIRGRRSISVFVVR